MASLIPRPRNVSKHRDSSTSIPQPRTAVTAKTTRARPLASVDATLQPSKAASKIRSLERDGESSVHKRRHGPFSDAQVLLPTQLSMDRECGRIYDSNRPHPNMLRRKRSLIAEHVKKRRESPPESGPGSLSIHVPAQTSVPSSTQVRSPNNNTAVANATMSPISSVRLRDVPYEVRGIFQAPTPLSDLSATPSLRNDSPSVFSQISPSSTATPTSASGYSPQIQASSHFGPGYATTSPSRKFEHRSEQIRAFTSMQADIDSQSGSSSRVPAEGVPGTQYGVYNTTAGINEGLGSSRQRPGPPPTTMNIADRCRAGVNTHAVIPELAHLAHATAPPSDPAIRAPSRPSRDGMEGLYGLPSIAPLSFLNGDPTGSNFQRRQSGSVQPILGRSTSSSRGLVSNQAVNRQLSQSQPSHSIAQTRLSIRPPEQPKLIDTTTSPASVSTQSRSATTPVSASSAKSGSRFGFFSRKEKTTSPVVDAESTIHAKKGPAAGTGHEGYGRHAGKRKSTGASSSRRLSGGSASSNDEFLASKAAPVYIRKDQDGQLASSTSSSTGFAGQRTSQQSSLWSSATSERSVATDAIASETRKQESLESSSRGRTASTSILHRPRKLSKDPKHGPASEPVSRLPTPFASFSTSSKTNFSIGETSKKPSLFNRMGFKTSRSKTPQDASQHVTKPTIMSSKVAPTPAQQQVPNRPEAHYDLQDTTDRGLHQSSHIPIEEISHILEEAALTDGEVHSEAEVPSRSQMPVLRLTSRSQKPQDEFVEVGLTLSPELQRQRSNKPDGFTNANKDHVQQPRVGTKQSHNSPKGHERTRAPNYSRPMQRGGPQNDIIRKDSLISGEAARQTSQLHHSRRVSLEGSINQELPRNILEASVKTDIGRPYAREGARPPSFLRMDSRKGSSVSVSSSSSSFYQPIFAGIAVQSAPGAPASPDELWHEYDDYIKDMTPDDSSQSQEGRSSSKQSDYFSSKSRSPSAFNSAGAKSTIAFSNLNAMASSPKSDLSPFVGRDKRSPHFGGLKHPAISAMPAPTNPLPPIPPHVSARSASGSLQNDPTSNLRRRGSSRGDHKSSGSRRLALPEPSDFSTRAPEISTMLTFGKPLFSPANDELEVSLKDELICPTEKVLVLDGLGKEWSIYCAKQYPKAHVVVHSPGPLEISPTTRTARPSNHRHVRHSDLAVKLPYPNDSFHTVVFRFPLATSEFSLGFAISECKRVLRPGGFIEICLLDLDLTVMGPETRRAIKGLKTRIQQTQPDVSLKPTSDYVQYLLGRYGFDDLHRCTLLSPVASAIPTTPSGSQDETATSRRRPSDHDETARNIAQLRTLAPQVGRWWYSQTFEQRTLAIEPGPSVWEDQRLLAECKEKDAGFKLLVCYAQKPSGDKRKTQSL